MLRGGMRMQQWESARRLPFWNVEKVEEGRRKIERRLFKEDLNFFGLTDDMAQDKSLWKSRIKVADHW